MCDPYLDYDSNKLLLKKKSELLLKKMLQLEKFECQLDIENIKKLLLIWRVW